MTMRQYQRNGLFTIELLASLLLVISILAVFAYHMTRFAHLSDILMTRQRAALAAEAVLNETRAGHEPSAADLATRCPRLTFEVQRRPGAGVWSGFTRITVKVQGAALGGLPVRTVLEGHIPEVAS